MVKQTNPPIYQHEFDCDRCGIHVIAFGPKRECGQTKCLECFFVSSIEDPGVRQLVERVLKIREPA